MMSNQTEATQVKDINAAPFSLALAESTDVGLSNLSAVSVLSACRSRYVALIKKEILIID